LEALLHDLEMEEPEEAGPESEAQRLRGLRFVDERRVVQSKLFHRILEERIVLRVGRVESREDHRLSGPVTRERRSRRARGVGEGVANAAIGYGLEAGRDVAGLAGLEARDRPRVGSEHA